MMIPLDNAIAILPRMTTGMAITGDFPLTIIKPPVLDTRSSPSAISSPIYRLLQSRKQRRNSSASSARSNCSTKTESKEFVTERVEVFELKDTGRHPHVESLLLQCPKQTACALRVNIGDCQEKSAPSRRSSLISSAKERHISIQEQPLELTPECRGVNYEEEQQRCTSTDLTMGAKQTENSSVEETKLESDNFPVMETKETENSPSQRVLNKRNRKKSCKSKKALKKRKNSVKKGAGVTGIFARLVGSHGQKRQQGQQVNSNEQAKPKASLLHARDTSPNKYLNIQKLHAAYAPKKNDNKNNAIVLPRVSNSSLTNNNSRSCASSPRKQDNSWSCTSSPRKQEQELERAAPVISPPLSSPRKLLNLDEEKVKKIYLSETHSGMITGIPCAPPSTPTVDELKKVEYIPSLTDIKSQRAVKTRLVNLGNKMRAEEQRKKDKAAKEEQKRAYGAILQLKQRQRAEIYALNKVMTELENDNFRKFMEENSAETLPV